MSGRIRVAEKSRRTMDGITFASMAEMNRYAELRMLEKAGVISGLEMQPRFELVPAFDDPSHGHQRAIVYRADFGYHEIGNPKRVIEDCKGFKTEVYRMKKKMLLFLRHDIDFREVKAKR